MDHKASLNTSFLELSSTIQGRNQGEKNDTASMLMQVGGKWRKRKVKMNKKTKQKQKQPKKERKKKHNTICTFKKKEVKNFTRNIGYYGK